MEKLTVNALISELHERGFVYSKIVDSVSYDMDNIRDEWGLDTELTFEEYEAIIIGFESEIESAQYLGA